MLKISLYYLPKPQKNDAATARLRVYVTYKRTREGNRIKKHRATFVIPLDFRTKDWDKEANRVRQAKKYVEANMINIHLGQIESALSQYELECKVNKEEATKEGVTEIVNAILGKETAPKEAQPVLFADVFQRFIVAAETGDRLSEKGNNIAVATIKKYKAHFVHLAPLEAWLGIKIDLGDLNKSLGQKMHIYFNEIGLAHNTKANILRTFIAVYNYAIEKGWTERSDFHQTRVGEDDSDTIALTQEEVDKIFKIKFTDEDPLEQTRDVFIIGIWTLMRFSDYATIKSYNIEDGVIRVRTTKTDVEVVVPMHWQLKETLDRYRNELPPLVSNQVFNRRIKDIARRAGITQMVEKTITRGGKRQKKVVPRCELVTTHTARRTGATLLYLDGVPKKQIMMLTGHRGEDIFDRYIRIGTYANARLLENREIFHKKESLPARASEFENGFYLLEELDTRSVVEIKEGILYRTGSEVRFSIDRVRNAGGRIVKKVALRE